MVRADGTLKVGANEQEIIVTAERRAHGRSNTR